MASNAISKPLSAGAWRARIGASRALKKGLLTTWQDNVAYRVGKPFKSMPDQDTVNVPADWARTKNKQAQLWYQVPEVFVEARRKEFAGAAPTFAAALNYRLAEEMHVEHVMNECLGDVINAAGIMIAKVGYEATFETVMMPAQTPPEAGLPGLAPPPPPAMGMTPPGMGMPPSMPPDTQGAESEPSEMQAPAEVEGVGAEEQPEAAAGQEPGLPPVGMGGMIPVQRPIYQCYYARRISPALFLWPTDFIGSNWQDAHWLGWDGYMSLAEAQRLKWVDENYEGTTIDSDEWLMARDNNELKSQDGQVKFSEIFYRPFYFDANEKDVRKIKRLVLVEAMDGDKAKVVDEDFAWQKYDQPTRTWVGMTTFPIKVATLVHVSDKAIPPSDSEAGRPMVREQIRFRSQLIKQRDHSMPIRWFDVNQVDDEIADRLRKGKWQDMIPMNGPGDHAIGEVARAAFPHESFEANQIIRQDLDESWSMGAPQMSQPTGGDTTATEIKSMQTSMNVRLSFEQGWAQRFFIEIAQGTAQLMQLFDDDQLMVNVIGPDGMKALQAWNKEQVPCECLFKIKPDSQLKLDAQQERMAALNMYKLLRQDPLVNPIELVGQVLEVHGFDPTKALAPPQPPKHEGPKMSYSFKGEDLANPIVVAIMQKGDSPLAPQDIDAAKKLIEDATALSAPGMPSIATGMGPDVGGATLPPPPTGANQMHGGPAPKVEELGRRYETAGSNIAGSRDSGLPVK